MDPKATNHLLAAHKPNQWNHGSREDGHSKYQSIERAAIPLEDTLSMLYLHLMVGKPVSWVPFGHAMHEVWVYMSTISRFWLRPPYNEISPISQGQPNQCLDPGIFLYHAEDNMYPLTAFRQAGKSTLHALRRFKTTKRIIYFQKRTTAPRIPAWSPTVVLTRRHSG